MPVKALQWLLLCMHRCVSCFLACTYLSSSAARYFIEGAWMETAASALGSSQICSAWLCTGFLAYLCVYVISSSRSES